MIENGGPAFPWGEHGDRLGGMSLRDYFAAAALTECPDPVTETDAPRIARLAYVIADAMIEARKC